MLLCRSRNRLEAHATLQTSEQNIVPNLSLSSRHSGQSAILDHGSMLGPARVISSGGYAETASLLDKACWNIYSHDRETQNMREDHS